MDLVNVRSVRTPWHRADRTVGIPPHHQPMTRDRLRALVETAVL